MGQNTLSGCKIEQYLDKPRQLFTREDIVRFVRKHEIQIINFHYVGGDGRIKTLNFPVCSRKQLENILTYGERVDGSSLFKNIEAGSSDLYVVPKYRSAFVNPFASIPTLGLFCQYFDKDGEPMAFTPDTILHRADSILKERTGYELQAMGELEYYVIAPLDRHYQANDQRGYHESTPFVKWENLRAQAVVYLTQMGCHLKYAHSEVGNFHDKEYNYEQNELEYLPVSLERAAEELILGRWVLRMLAYQQGVLVSFAPKITVGKAGSGLHIHMRLLKKGISVMSDGDNLSEIAIKAIGGILELAPAITAFGNMVPTSYLRLVPHQEAPTNICWGYRNRSSLIRVPLGWTGHAKQMMNITNPCSKDEKLPSAGDRQTFEFRCPDGSANVHLLLASLAVAVRYGLETDSSFRYAMDRLVDVNIFKDEHKHIQDKLEKLPDSCDQSADMLLKFKDIFLQYDVFHPAVIDGTVNLLKSYQDRGLSEKLYGQTDEIKKLVMQYIHC